MDGTPPTDPDANAAWRAQMIAESATLQAWADETVARLLADVARHTPEPRVALVQPSAL